MTIYFCLIVGAVLAVSLNFHSIDALSFGKRDSLSFLQSNGNPLTCKIQSHDACLPVS